MKGNKNLKVGRWMKMAALSFVVCHLSFSKAQAQSLVNFGFKGGLELVDMNFSVNDLNSSNRAGFYIGPSLRINLPITHIGFDASLFYSQRDLKVDDEKIQQKSLLLPANARFGFAVGDVVKIFASAGPQLSINVGDDIFHWKDEEGKDSQFSLQNTMLSANFGLGVGIGSHLEVAAYYNMPIGKTADFTWEILDDKLKEQTWERAKSRANAWHVSVSYYF